jgi:hypothetical protein
MMKRLSGYLFGRLVLAVFVCIVLMSSGCAASRKEGFAIYLTAEDVPPAQMADSSDVAISDTPIIALKDIVAYDPYTHEITLTASAFDRISILAVPVSGKSFVVCVDMQVMYWGAFWTPVSSLSFDGVTIWQWPGSPETNVIQLKLGYPSPAFYNNEDPRNNATVMASLQQANKLSSVPIAITIDTLPSSIKGYELYSWQEGTAWHFTMMTGTNRNKTMEEVISIVNTVSGDDWVHVHVVGIEAIKSVLDKLPRDEYVSWLGELRTKDTSISGMSITLPDETIIAAVREQAARSGLNLTVQAP